MDAEGKQQTLTAPTPQEDDPFSIAPATDKFLKKLDEYIKKNIHESVKQKAKSSSGKFYSNRVLTVLSGSNISSHGDPKATVFPIPIPASDESVLGYHDDEGDSILSQSKKFDTTTKKKMVGKMLNCAPERYTNTIRSYNEAHVGPIMTDLTNALLFLGGVAQMVAKTKRENERYVHVSQCADNFITAKCSEIELNKQHVIETLFDNLRKTKEKYRYTLVRNQELYAELDVAKKAKQLANEEIEEMNGRIKALTEENDQIDLLKATNQILFEEMDKIKRKA